MSYLWPSLWLLSGVVSGIVAVVTPPSQVFILLVLSLVLNLAHTFSPAVLAWSTPGLRKIALEHKAKSIALPVVAMVLALCVPLQAFAGDYFGWPKWLYTGVYRYGMMSMTGFYWSWNAWHYAMQNFGVLSIWAGRMTCDTRVKVILVILCLTIAAMSAAALYPDNGEHQKILLFVINALSFNHWLTDIVLSGRVSKRAWLFFVMLLPIGCIGLVELLPGSAHLSRHIVGLALAAFYGTGYTHFYYSAWVWKLSDPQVRAAVGPSLFREARVAR